MKNPTHAEAIELIILKRKNAKSAMWSIIDHAGVITNEAGPGLTVFIDYFANMVYAIELLLKVLSNDWANGKTRFRHNVDEMYREIFGRDYSKSDLLCALKEAILDQKFLFEPDPGIVDRVQELEELWDELTEEFYQRFIGQIFHYDKEVTLSRKTVEYLSQHVHRFYTYKTVRHNCLPANARIRMHQHQIAMLEKEIDRLRQLTKTSREEMDEAVERSRQEALDTIQSRASMMALKLAESWLDPTIFTGVSGGQMVITRFLG